MTPAELKQAIRCHIYSISGDCSQCPLKGKMYAVCSKELETEVLNYIDELEKKSILFSIEKLQLLQEIDDIGYYAKVVDRALQIAYDLGELCAPLDDYIAMARKEFEEAENELKGEESNDR